MLQFAKSLALFIILAGIAVAILRMFGWDPFGVIDWAIGFVWYLVDAIATWLEGTSLRHFFSR